jgi:hypothetical protein
VEDVIVAQKFAERTKAEMELADLLRSIDLSAPSSTKFEPIRAWAADRAGLEKKRVSVYWVSKPGNFDVRFRQPGVLRDNPFLGIALVPGGDNLEGYVKPARRLVENRLFQAIIICSRDGSEWVGEAGFATEEVPFDVTVGGLISPEHVLEVGDPEQSEAAVPVEPSADERPISDVAGLDFGKPFGWGEYPLDSVFVRTEARTVAEVVRRIRAGRYQLDPDFQRDFVWSEYKQSRLIESCLMRIPLPVFYVAEAKDGRIIVVDGLQRLTTFKRFMDNEFALSGLDDDDEGTKHRLLGFKFKDLPLSLAERIEDTQLTLYVLDAKAPDRAKLDIFERVNSGSPLSRQQMRNCLYNGPATQWLKTAASDPAFLRATGESLNAKLMRDREVINRFCAFHLLGWESYAAGDMDGFLASALERMNESTSDQLDALDQAFRQSMRLNSMLFGQHAFRKSLAAPDADAFRTVINIAMFDVFSVLFATLNPNLVEREAAPLRETVRDLLGSDEFNRSLTYSTNSTRQVRARFSIASEAVKRVLSC